MNFELQSPQKPDSGRVVYEFVSHDELSPVEQDAEINRMIEFNGLVAFDPEMFGLAA
ncbi:MAG: hypothetical protein KDH17_12660 [Rhodocyclaceae bacterium]|nr:hypothetical protein [Rhodocyclaceae bacterium]MCB1928870.1 hypothetical protein [Rhodocyclaceae bacterium]MCP5234337.1 hypothetical protein [Zoogloeaceae bacterium]